MEYYSLLEVEQTSTKDEIKRSYRKLAMKYHPDRNKWDKEAEAKFKQINEAYGVLSDDAKRRSYDTYGKAGAGWNPFGWWAQGFDVDLWDIFSSFFGGQAGWWRRRANPNAETRWEDVETYVQIELGTAIQWWKKNITYNVLKTCHTCSWVGWEKKTTCQKCSGQGYVTYTKQSMFGVVQQTWVCDECHGSGENFEELCEMCNGQKRVSTRVDYELDIPVGIDDGMVIKIEWEWNDGINTKAKWALYIKFKVEQEYKWLKRDGIDLHYNHEIHVLEAILGTTKEIIVPILGKRTIEVKSGTQVGTIAKTAWAGIKDVQYDRRGDLFVHLDIKIPKKLSKVDREIYTKLAYDKKINVHNHTGILEKLFW